MSISIYYTALRNRPLSPDEHSTIGRLLSAYAIKKQIEEYNRTGEGPNWESFCVYDPADPTEPGAIFEGATRLPDNSAEAAWIGLQHWCRLLSEVRRVLPEAAWQVHVDDHDLVWDASRSEYDPSS